MALQAKFIGTRSELAVAYHEAAHAAMARFVGLPPMSATIVSSEGALGSVLHSTGSLRSASLARYGSTWQNDRNAMVAMAGAIGEWSVQRKFVHGGLGGDRDSVYALVPSRFGEVTGQAWVEYLWHRSIDELVSPAAWPAVEQIAKALLERKKLSRREVIVAGNQNGDFSEEQRRDIWSLNGKLHRVRCPFLV